MVAPALALAGVNALSSVAGLGANRRARNAQRNATNTAVNRQDYALRQQTGRLQPYADVGAKGLNALDAFQFNPVTAATVRDDPGYQFARDEGIRDIESTAAAKGGLYSGNALEALTAFNSGNANRFFNDAFNRNQQDTAARFGRAMQTAGVGERAVGDMNRFTGHNADVTGQYITGQGNAEAASQLAEGRIWQDMIGGFGGAMGGGAGGAGAMGGAGGVPMTPGVLSPSTYSGWGAGFGFKDGGPVMVDDGTGRMVPKVGTRSALPGAGGTGGGLSREAVIAELSRPPAAAAASAPAANPLNPRAVQADREQRAGLRYADGGRVSYEDGGMVEGPGGPQDDAIPAWLSNGEHVLTADQVAAVGGGDPMAGHNILMMLPRKRHGLVR